MRTAGASIGVGGSLARGAFAGAGAAAADAGVWDVPEVVVAPLVSCVPDVVVVPLVSCVPDVAVPLVWVEAASPLGVVFCWVLAGCVVPPLRDDPKRPKRLIAVVPSTRFVNEALAPKYRTRSGVDSEVWEQREARLSAAIFPKIVGVSGIQLIQNEKIFLLAQPG